MKNSDKYYTGLMIQSTKKWREFAGNCFLIGVAEGWSFALIKEYIFESFHELGLDQIPANINDLKEDMRLYKENYIK